MWPGALPLLVLLATLLHPSRCTQTQAKMNFREKEKQVLDNILGPGRYDARIRPSGENRTDGPTNVKVNIFLRSISKIDDYNMEYSVQLTFREQWLDERLQFDDFGGKLKYLTLTEASRVWMPDLFFSNEKEGHFHNIIMPNVYIRIFPNGSVLYSIRISLTLSCPMNLKLYPLDRQVCSLRMASYGWTTDDLVFLWKEGDPVQVVKNLHLPRFTLEKFLTDYCNSKTNTGEYSCLKVDLLFKREFSYYLIQIYIPCCMLVIVSWVSFWLDQSAVPARVSLGVTTLLTMATQTSGINASLPPVSYTKAIDVWTGVCLTFVFGALLEFALVNYASRSDMHSDNMKKQFPPSEMEHSSSIDPSSELLEPDGSANFAMKPLVRHPEDSMSMDKLRQCEIHMQPRKKKLLQVVAVQVPDEVQAHRRHLTDLLPNRIRFLQPRVLVHVPISGGGGGRVNHEEEALGSTREVARGHPQQQQFQQTRPPQQRSRPRHRQPYNNPQNHHHHHPPQNHHHNHHHHHHHHYHQQLQRHQRAVGNQTMSQHHSLPRMYQQDHNQQQQQHHHQSHRHQRYHPDRSPSPSFSPLNDEDCVTGRCSPMRPSRHHSRRSSARSSPSPSRWPSPASSASPLGTPSRMSRAATPSPPIAVPTSSVPPPTPATVSSRKGCWDASRKLLTCRAQGSARIDIFARVAFPLMFILFNFAYWSIYLFRGEDNVGIRK